MHRLPLVRVCIAFELLLWVITPRLAEPEPEDDGPEVGASWFTPDGGGYVMPPDE